MSLPLSALPRLALHARRLEQAEAEVIERARKQRL